MKSTHLTSLPLLTPGKSTSTLSLLREAKLGSPRTRYFGSTSSPPPPTLPLAEVVFKDILCTYPLYRRIGAWWILIGLRWCRCCFHKMALISFDLTWFHRVSSFYCLQPLSQWGVRTFWHQTPGCPLRLFVVSCVLARCPPLPSYSSKPPKNLYPTCRGSKSTRDLYSVKPSTLPVLVSQTFHGNCDDKSKENLRKLKIRNSQSIVGRSLTAPIQYPSFY